LFIQLTVSTGYLLSQGRTYDDSNSRSNDHCLCIILLLRTDNKITFLIHIN